MLTAMSLFVLIFTSLTLFQFSSIFAFPWFEKGGRVHHQLANSTMSVPSPAISVASTISFPPYAWSPGLLVDVTGDHAYQDPQPGQARGPCPAQNALANHGYLDRSGYTTFLACVQANGVVFNLGPDLAGILCLFGQLFGGDILGADPWSLGNSSTFDSTVSSVCVTLPGLPGIIQGIICNLSSFLDNALGTSGYGMAQTHNSFEGDSSFLSFDWGMYGIDASTVDISAANTLWSKYRDMNGNFDNYTQIIDWASYRKNYCIATNPCYFRVPGATIAAALGAYAFLPRMFSNNTPTGPTLSSGTMASWFGLDVASNGAVTTKGFGKEQIPANWYFSPRFITSNWLTKI